MKKNIIFYTGTLFEGGAERVLAFLATRFTSNYNVEIICHYNAPRFYDVPSSINVIDLEKDWGCNGNLKKAIALRKYILKYNQDDTVLVSFMMPFFIFTGIALGGVGVPIIAAERSNPFKETFIRRILTRLLEKRYSAIVVQSKGAAEFYKRADNLIVIHNPIKEEFLNVIHRDPDALTVLSLGRLVSVKNYSMLINSFAIVNKKFPDAMLIIYGNGVEKDILEKKAKELKIEENVLLPGATHDVVSVLDKASIYVCSSNYEGMSNAIIEAMACGVPVISTKVFGSIDFIQDGVNGRLVNVGDSEGMASAIIQLLGNKELRHKIGIKGQEVKNELMTDDILRQWFSLIESV